MEINDRYQIYTRVHEKIPIKTKKLALYMSINIR
eukprot:UN16946